MKEDLKIRSVHDAFTAAESAIKKFGYGAQLWWRGQPKHEWPLVPGVHREGRDYNYELNVTRRFIQGARARHDQCPADDIPAWLFLMQHYRLPTRLLDWTESVLIATYFATCEQQSGPGVLWALNPYLLNNNQVGKKVLASPLGDLSAQLFRRPFNLKASDEEKIVAVIADQYDVRMLVQLSAFTIHGTRRALETIEGAERFLTCFEVPESAKDALKEQLSSLGVRGSSLFPDLEHLAADLTKLKFLESP